MHSCITVRWLMRLLFTWHTDLLISFAGNPMCDHDFSNALFGYCNSIAKVYVSLQSRSPTS
jgi:hypothetical protein